MNAIHIAKIDPTACRLSTRFLATPCGPLDQAAVARRCGERASLCGCPSAQEPSRRWQAAAGLGRDHQRSPETIAALIAALADPEPIVRWEAAMALAGPRRQSCFPHAECEPGCSRSAPAARARPRRWVWPAAKRLARCWRSIGRCGPARAARSGGGAGPDRRPDLGANLMPLLADENADDPPRRGACLGRIGDPKAAVPLAEALAQSDQPVLVRRALAAALARAAHPDAQPALLEALADPDPQVRGYAAKALGQVGNGAALEALARVKVDRSVLLRGTVGDAAARALTMLERRGRRATSTHAQRRALRRPLEQSSEEQIRCPPSAIASATHACI